MSIPYATITISGHAPTITAPMVSRPGAPTSLAQALTVTTPSGYESWYSTESDYYQAPSSLRADAPGYGDTARARMDVSFDVDGTLTFYTKTFTIGCELRVIVDGTTELTLDESTGWAERELSISAGDHVILFDWVQVSAQTSTTDAAWIDAFSADGLSNAGWPAPVIEATGFAPGTSWSIPAGAVVRQYVCRLYLDDIELPCSSFTLWRRFTSGIYLSAVVPDVVAHAATVSAHSTGVLKIRAGYRYADDTEILETLAEADMESISAARGARSSSISLTARRSVTYESFTPRLLSPRVISKSTAQDGHRTWTMSLDLFVRPGDSAFIGDDVAWVQDIGLEFSPTSHRMTIIEGLGYA